MTRRYLLTVALLTLASMAFTSQLVYIFADVPYRFPDTAGGPGTVLINDGTGGLTWTSLAVPAGTIAYTTTGSCPAGWSEVTSARGRYLVALPSGGTHAGTVGTALANTENRATGSHNHLVSGTHNHTQNAHGHGVTDPGHTHSSGSYGSAQADSGGSGVTTGGSNTNSGGATPGVSVVAATAGNIAATTGVTIDNAGSVAGTNAPYLQLMACSKD